MAEFLAKADFKNEAKYDKKDISKRVFEKPVFSVKHFCNQVKKLLNNKNYEIRARRLKAISRTTGGSKLAVKTIESAFINYSCAKAVNRNGTEIIEASHLVDNDFYAATD